MSLRESSEDALGASEVVTEEEAQAVLKSVGTRPQTDMGSGDVFFELYDSMERFTSERIVLICKRLKLDEDMIIEIIKANMQLARQSKRRIGDGRRPKRAYLEESLAASGLI